MRSVTLNKRTALSARLGLGVSTTLLLAVFFAPAALMQQVNGQAQVAERVTATVDPTGKRQSVESAAMRESSAPSPIIPEVAGNYVFVTATNASLTDMSSGTTLLLDQNIDGSMKRL